MKSSFRSHAHKRGDDRWLAAGLILFLAVLTAVAFYIGGPQY